MVDFHTRAELTIIETPTQEATRKEHEEERHMKESDKNQRNQHQQELDCLSLLPSPHFNFHSSFCSLILAVIVFDLILCLSYCEFCVRETKIMKKKL